MNKALSNKYYLYRYRYSIGFIILALVVVGVLFFAYLHVPGGVTTEEQQSALVSNSIKANDPKTWLMLDAPYHMLQKASISFFGLSNYSIKLPSLLIGLASALGLVLFLRHWFRDSVSIIASALTLFTAQFVLYSQQGTPAIMHIFWPIVILLFASFAIQRTRFSSVAAIVTAVLAALSLYTPLSFIVLVALICGSLLHPHVRYLLRQQKITMLTIAAILALVTLVPLAYLIYKQPSIAVQLLIMQSTLSIDVLGNLKLLVAQYLDFSGLTAEKSHLLTPLFGLSTFLILLTGAYALFRRHHTVKSYVISAWILLLIPILILSPRGTSVMFVPAVLLIAVGMTAILHYWYRLFPTNPYARTFALLPLGLLVGTIAMTTLFRYYYTMQYNPAFTTRFSDDLTLISQTLRASSDNAVVVVTEQEKELYTTFIETHKLPVTVDTTSSSLFDSAYTGKTIIATRDSAPVKENRLPQRIVASHLAGVPSDRFYVYKNNAD